MSVLVVRFSPQIEIIYRVPTGNILSPRWLQRIAEIDALVRSQDGYEDFCALAWPDAAVEAAGNTTGGDSSTVRAISALYRSPDGQRLRARFARERERAKADAKSKKGQHADTGVYRGILDEHGPTDWLAYETLETESRALALLVGGAPATSLAQGEVGELVLDRTPFYAKSGGQAADAGIIEVDGARLEVLDVQRPVRGLVVHQVLLRNRV